jgi:hypothetical protein
MSSRPGRQHERSDHALVDIDTAFLFLLFIAIATTAAVIKREPWS